MEEEQKKKRKKFISEKIVGRELTARHAGKYLLLALLCGALFGGCAALVFCGIRNSALGEGRSSREAELSVPKPREQETPEAQEEAPADMEEETETIETTEDIEAIVRNEVEHYSYTAEDFQTMLLTLRDSAAEAGRYIVSVQSVHRDTGWFNDPIETAQLSSGVIISAEGSELLILTSEAAVRNADQLIVTFQDGTAAEAVLRQDSRLDGAALLAVPKSELDGSGLEAFSAIPFGSQGSLRPGDLILAVGSPLGVARSIDVGFIGYIRNGEQIPDASQDVLYAEIASDAEKGTFLLNLKGELIGMARAETDEGLLNGRSGAIGISRLRVILNRLREGRKLPYLGIEGRTVSAEMLEEGIPAGVYVTNVRQESPAYNAGIKSGDILTSLSGTELDSMTAYETMLLELDPGDEAVLSVKRSSINGEYRDLSYTMAVSAR